MNDDPHLLASAYLDDEVTPDERALVETDPELIAEVERLRTVRLLVGDVEGSPISRREAQLAAALDTWDQLAARDSTPTGTGSAAAAGAASVTARSTSSRRRNGTGISTRWLTGAAAALALVVVGGVALQLAGTGQDDSTADSADSADSAAAVGTRDGAGESADATGADSADVVAAPESATLADDESVELDTAPDEPPPPIDDGGLEQLRNPDDLAAFAGLAIGAPSAPDGPAATSAPFDQFDDDADVVEIPLCLGVDLVVGPALYGNVEVIVGIDQGRNLALAYVADCTEIARVRVPSD